jgi:putative RNA 2'-phosphotransferase
MDYNELSKEISYALRHAPWEYELDMDNEGFVNVDQLIKALKKVEKWKNIDIDFLNKMIENSEKKRHEIVNGKIRAFYGHSIPMRILKEEKIPPKYLYHGTARKFLDSIMENGILKKSRQYAYLSSNVETATIVGKRRDAHPIILTIDAEKASKDGVKFYFGNEMVWLADFIPSKYIVEKKNVSI